MPQKPATGKTVGQGNTADAASRVHRIRWALVVRGPRGTLAGVVGWFLSGTEARDYAREQGYANALVLPGLSVAAGAAR